MSATTRFCYQNTLPFPPIEGRKVEVEFSGGDITSNGGAALIRQVDRRLGLSDAVARALLGPRRQASCLHKLATMVRQRLHALALAYEDLNDHQTLRPDAGLQTAASSTSPLASPATLWRLEQAANTDDAIGLHKVLCAQFIKAERRRSKRSRARGCKPGRTGRNAPAARGSWGTRAWWLRSSRSAAAVVERVQAA